jgi:hypothetical protein
MMKDYEIGLVSFVMITVIIGALFFLQGCADKRDSLLITKPPMQIAFQGDVDTQTTDDLLRLMQEASTIRHVEYDFDKNTSVKFNISDTKSSAVSETTSNTFSK